MKYNYNYKNAQGDYAPYVLPLQDGRKVINPTAAMYAEAGYLPYTPPQPSEEEINRLNCENEIESLRDQLYDTDYIPLKAIEGYDCDTLYPGWKEQRKKWRDRINELQNNII